MIGTKSVEAAGRHGVVDAIAAVAAVLLVTGGAIHLRLYFDGYRDVPNSNLGRSFLLNAVASAACAVLLLAWRSWLSPVAGLLATNGTLIGFGLSRTSRGVFDFTERGFNPRPEAAMSLAVELAAAVLLLIVLALRFQRTARVQ